MGTIEAIQTEYNGFKFRSRLEARWAVFFDSSEIEYHYEPEGFELSDGTKYLPDFYLPGYDSYVEVKPYDKKRVSEIEKCFSFCKYSKNKKIIILSNIPPKTESPFWWFPCIYCSKISDTLRVRPVCIGVSPDYLYSDMYAPILVDIEAKEWLLGYSASVFNIWAGSNGLLNDKDLPWVKKPSDCDWYDVLSKNEISNLSKSYDAARKARFEYGETPKAETIY